MTVEKIEPRAKRAAAEVGSWASSRTIFTMKSVHEAKMKENRT